MFEVLGLALPVLIVAASVFVLFKLPVERAPWVGVTSAIVMAVLVPSFSTSAPVAVEAVMGTCLVLGLCFWRDRTALLAARHSFRWPILLLSFIVWTSTIGSIGSPIKLVLLNLGTGVLLGLLALLTVAAASRRFTLFIPLFGAIIAFEVLLGIAEEFLGLPALWPRSNGSDVIANRVNSVLPALVGRAMGSTSQPIPYGMLIGFSIIVCVWFGIVWRKSRRRSLTLIGLAMVGLVGLVFSGTRPAFLGLLTVAIVAVILRYRRRIAVMGALALVVVGGGVVAVIAVFNSGNQALLGSVSVVHRLGIIETASNLFSRDPISVLFGSGYYSTGTLIKTGVVHGVVGINVFDQEFVRTLASTGVVGLILLISVIALGFVRGTDLSRLLIVFVTFGLFSFDGLSWRLIATLFVFSLAYGYGKRVDRESLLPRSSHALMPTTSG